MSREDFDLIPFHRGVHSSNFFDDTTHNADAQKTPQIQDLKWNQFHKSSWRIFFQILGNFTCQIE